MMIRMLDFMNSAVPIRIRAGRGMLPPKSWNSSENVGITPNIRKPIAPTATMIITEGYDGYHFEWQNDPKQAVEAAQGEISLLGGISNIEGLLQGTPDDVYRQARYNIEAGVDSIGPECAISLATPLANLKAIVAAAAEGY